MKRIVLLCAFALLATNHLFAQAAGLDIGIHFTPQNTWLFDPTYESDDKNTDYDFTIGTAYGASLGYNFGPGFGVKTGITFSSQGQLYKVSSNGKGSGITDTYRHTINYVKVPLLLHFSTSPDFHTGLVFDLGIQFGFLSDAGFQKNGADDKDTYDVLRTSNLASRDLYKGTDLAAVLGFGPRFSINENFSITAMFRFDYSLGDISNHGLVSDLGRLQAGLQGNKQLLGFYNGGGAMNNATAGLQIGLNYTFNQ